MTCNVDPKAPKIEADQKTSDTAAGRACNAPHFPYFCVKGSIMVTYAESLIFFAKKVPDINKDNP